MAAPYNYLSRSCCFRSIHLFQCFKAFLIHLDHFWDQEHWYLKLSESVSVGAAVSLASSEMLATVFVTISLNQGIQTFKQYSYWQFQNLQFTFTKAISCFWFSIFAMAYQQLLDLISLRELKHRLPQTQLTTTFASFLLYLLDLNHDMMNYCCYYLKVVEHA